MDALLGQLQRVKLLRAVKHNPSQTHTCVW
jgi:hypothetical protein